MLSYLLETDCACTYNENQLTFKGDCSAMYFDSLNLQVPNPSITQMYIIQYSLKLPRYAVPT
jgi:hypothetical protein